MRKLVGLTVVVLGYVAALVAACVAVYIRVLETQNDPAVQASAGMYAFGDFLLFVAVFGAMSLVPTALLLYFLRPYKAFWSVLSLAGLALAVIGPVAAAIIQHSQAKSLITELFWCGQVTGSPLLTLGFLTCTVMAPNARSRWTLLAAALIEAAVSAYAFLCLFVLGHWLW